MLLSDVLRRRADQVSAPAIGRVDPGVGRRRDLARLDARIGVRVPRRWRRRNQAVLLLENPVAVCNKKDEERESGNGREPIAQYNNNGYIINGHIKKSAQ